MLMNTSCATESGKSRGQFCTPAEDRRVIARVLRIRDATAATTEYDPTCGFDSLLIQIGGEAARGTDLIDEDGCVTAAQPRLIIDNKRKKTKARLNFHHRPLEVSGRTAPARADHRAHLRDQSCGDRSAGVRPGR